MPISTADLDLVMTACARSRALSERLWVRPPIVLPDLPDKPVRRTRKRRPSITTLFRQTRKAGERGPVSVRLPDGTTITSASDGTVEQMTDAAAERLWQARMAKHAH